MHVCVGVCVLSKIVIFFFLQQSVLMAFLKMLVLLVLVTISLSEGHGRAPINLDKERVAQGEKALMSVQKEADHSMCWRAPVARYVRTHT